MIIARRAASGAVSPGSRSAGEGAARPGPQPQPDDEADAPLDEAAPEAARPALAAMREAVRDFASRDLFATILKDEEGHIDFIETQFELIKRVGLQNYVQLNAAAG